MKYSATFAIAALAGIASASPASRRALLKAKREVPQEHSHDIFLDIVREFVGLDNQLQLADPVFPLLGNAAAADGVPNPEEINLDCLKQLTADLAFTNAKAVGDVRGMAGALVYQALERNTGSVGLASVICPEDAVNPEIAAFDQHQDPASAGAADINKAITLELARQLAAIGVDPLVALESGTFAPGEIGDPTAAGNTCDTVNDLPGCIFTQRLLVLDATPEEVLAAVADVAQTFTGTGVISATNIDFAGLSVAAATGVVDATATAAVTGTCSVITTAVPSAVAASLTGGGAATGAAATKTAAADTAKDTNASSAAGANIQSFTGALGGLPPAVIETSGNRPFSVNGNTFTGRGAALTRSCDIQHNACANAANSGALAGGVGQCETQLSECKASNALRKRQASDFGTCADPSIEFGVGFDGRKQGSFQPADLSDFNHGSALKIGVISSFICQRLKDTCRAPAATQAVCEQASTAAQAATQDQAAADAFNSILLGGASGTNKGNTGNSGNAATATPASQATPCEQLVLVTITQCA